MRSKPMHALSILCSLLAIVLAAMAMVSTRRAEERAYQRVVAETWSMALPVYEDFGLALPDHPPATLREAMEPLIRAANTLEDTN